MSTTTPPSPAERTPGAPPPFPRIGLVHDYFSQLGGAERMVFRLATMFPDAPMFTSVVDPAILPASLDPARLTTSRLQRTFAAGLPLKALAPVLAGAMGDIDLGDLDVVLSTSSAFGHRIRPRRSTVHVCYCHTPPPFLYRRDEYFASRRLLGSTTAPILGLMRRRDRAAAQGVDRYVANSSFTADRVRRNYGIEADVIYPGIDTAAFAPTTERSGRFLAVARLRPQKSLDLAIRAANQTGLPLDIIGEGSDRARLEALAGPTVRFLGRRSDAEVADAMARCVALLVPGIEDFGMVTAEVQAAGRPPIGFAGGGTIEIVTDGRTGFLVSERTSDAFAGAMRRALDEEISVTELVGSARRFDIEVFASGLRRVLADAVDARPPRGTTTLEALPTDDRLDR